MSFVKDYKQYTNFFSENNTEHLVGSWPKKGHLHKPRHKHARYTNHTNTHLHTEGYYILLHPHPRLHLRTHLTWQDCKEAHQVMPHGWSLVHGKQHYFYSWYIFSWYKVTIGVLKGKNNTYCCIKFSGREKTVILLLCTRFLKKVCKDSSSVCDTFRQWKVKSWYVLSNITMSDRKVKWQVFLFFAF